MSKSNQAITFQGEPLAVSGAALEAGAKLPEVKLTATDMSDLSLAKLKGKVAVILSVPSLDTPVCSIETKRFNHEVASLSPDITVLAVSRDLPFAQKRWCGAEGVESVLCASDYKYRSFGAAFGTEIDSWGLLARAVFVVDRSGTIAYVEYVSEVSAEPDYSAVLAAVKALI